MRFIETNLWQDGKERAVTFSYDDGRIEDKRLVALFNKYNVKGTFHLCNPGFDGYFRHMIGEPEFVSPDEYNTLYEGHEISCHGADHPFMKFTPESYVRRQISDNRVFLENICSYPVRGMSYPFSSLDDNVIRACVGEGMEYARTAAETGEFYLPADFMKWDATCHHSNITKELWERFLSPMRFDFMRLFYVWGHSYEFYSEEHWEKLENDLKMIGGREDIWYATNIEIVDYVKALRALRFTSECHIVYNPSCIDVWISVDRKKVCIPGGKTVKL
ncbi:MAG: polysaccharide deacetylase [Ruminococcaceae bacterium]|nr:polysaccharide deacetylase [Oscillospiraceae bacterium]